jgi:class 3 adenylate cyclase
MPRARAHAARVHPETRYAETSGGYVAYQVFGDGPINVIFGTPWAWNIEAMWEEPRVELFFRRLSSFSRVAIFDKRGTGVSDPVPLGALPTIEQWSDDFRAVLDDLTWDRAALIAAAESSFTGTVFAASHPDRIAALVIIGGYACGTRKDDFRPGLPPRLIDITVDNVRATALGTFDATSTLAPSTVGDEAFRRWFQRFYRMSTPPTAIARMFRNGLEWDVRSILSTIRVPTLVLHRAEDRWVLVGQGRYLAEHIPGATYVELPGADNLFFAGEQTLLLDEIQGFLTGVRGVPEIDRVLATVLFTDIVASTDRAAEMGDRRWRETLDAHDRLVQAHVEHFRGKHIKTTGDGVLATFDGPARAIRCARAIADEVDGKLGIEIRAGLHTGEVELRGDDIGGLSVAIAARVMAEAGPGECITSITVKDLVIGSGLEFEDRGAHELKGVPGEWRLFVVRS